MRHVQENLRRGLPDSIVPTDIDRVEKIVTNADNMNIDDVLAIGAVIRARDAHGPEGQLALTALAPSDETGYLFKAAVLSLLHNGEFATCARLVDERLECFPDDALCVGLWSWLERVLLGSPDLYRWQGGWGRRSLLFGWSAPRVLNQGPDGFEVCSVRSRQGSTCVRRPTHGLQGSSERLTTTTGNGRQCIERSRGGASGRQGSCGSAIGMASELSIEVSSSGSCAGPHGSRLATMRRGHRVARNLSGASCLPLVTTLCSLGLISRVG
jgi:hypothetical protein